MHQVIDLLSELFVCGKPLVLDITKARGHDCIAINPALVIVSITNGSFLLRVDFLFFHFSAVFQSLVAF